MSDRRGVFIALSLACIFLIALIVYSSIILVSEQTSYNNLQNQNKQLQTWLDENETLLNQTQVNNTNLQGQIDHLQSEIATLQNQLSNLTHALNTAQGVEDGLQLTMTLEKTNYSLGEPINMTLVLANISNQTIKFWISGYYPEQNLYNFQIVNGTGSTVYSTLSPSPYHLPLEILLTINSGQSWNWNLSWNQQDYNTNATQGTYYILGQVGPMYLPQSTVTIETTPIQITIS